MNLITDIIEMPQETIVDFLNVFQWGAQYLCCPWMACESTHLGQPG